MKTYALFVSAAVASQLIAGPGVAQQRQKTEADITTVGPGSKAYKQQSDGEDITQVGPGSKAYKQKTQSLSHAGPGVSTAAKQN